MTTVFIALLIASLFIWAVYDFAKRLWGKHAGKRSSRLSVCSARTSNSGDRLELLEDLQDTGGLGNSTRKHASL